MMDYPCGKFGDLSFSRFGFIIQTNRHAHTHWHVDAQTDADERYTHTIVVGVNKDEKFWN